MLPTDWSLTYEHMNTLCSPLHGEQLGDWNAVPAMLLYYIRTVQMYYNYPIYSHRADSDQQYVEIKQIC